MMLRSDRVAQRKPNDRALAKLCAHQLRSRTDRRRVPQALRYPSWYWLRAFALIFLLLWGPTQPVSAEEIVLGMSAPFSGPNSGLGIELYRGSMAYFEQINSQGGVHGRRIVIKAYDDAYNPAAALGNTNRLISVDQVFVLFNYVGTPTTSRCLPLLKRHSDQSVLLFFPFTGAQIHRQQPYDEFVLNLRASYYQETAGLVDHFVGVGRKRVAVFYQIDSYGRNGWEGVRAALARHQLRMAGEATYRRDTAHEESMREQVDLLRKVDADAIICIGTWASGSAFIRDARDAGWNVPIANISFADSERMLEQLREAGKVTGTDYTRNLVNSQVVPSHDDESLPTAREYHQLIDRFPAMPRSELLQEVYQPPGPNSVSFEGFLNAKLLVAILEKMGPPFERQRLKPAVESVHKLDLGINEPASFGQERHQAFDRVYYMTVQEGRFTPFEDWERWRK